MPSSFANIVEPAVIVSIFTIASLVNRRKDCHKSHDIECRPLAVEDDSGYYNSSGSSSPSHSPLLKPVDPAPSLDRQSSRSKTSNLFFDLLSRFWNKFPFLAEIWYWNLTYWIYQLLRALSARMIAGNQPIFDLARTHALQILSVERYIGIDMELGFQRFILASHPSLMASLARVYYSHISIGVAFIAYAYTYTPRSAYKRARNTLAADNAMAFLIVTLWRCSPPRLLPPAYGYVDVLHPGPGSGGGTWTHNRFQLTIAAMPSLHFGTALLLAVYLCRFAPHRAVRWLAPCWPVVMLVTIVATANHFLLDAAVGAAIPWLGWRYGGVMGRLGVVQDWVFGPLRRRMDIVGDQEGRDGEKMMVD